MTEYIERQAAIDALGEEPEVWTTDNEWDMGAQEQWRFDYAAIEAIPPVDVRPVVRGRWEWNEDDGHCYCTACGSVSPESDQNGDECDCPNFCPHCGSYNGLI